MAAIGAVNKECDTLRFNFCPLLLKVQREEESRIQFVKNSLKKVMRHFSQLGERITQSGKDIGQQTEFVSSDTDLRMFIDSQKQTEEYPTDHSFSVEAYKPSVDVQKYKQELAARNILETADQDESDEDGVLIFNDHGEKVRKVIYTLVMKEEVCSNEDRGYILHTCKLPEVRDELQQYFKQITVPRQIQSAECFEVLAHFIMAYID